MGNFFEVYSVTQSFTFGIKVVEPSVSYMMVLENFMAFNMVTNLQ